MLLSTTYLSDDDSQNYVSVCFIDTPKLSYLPMLIIAEAIIHDHIRIKDDHRSKRQKWKSESLFAECSFLCFTNQMFEADRIETYHFIVQWWAHDLSDLRVFGICSFSDFVMGISFHPITLSIHYEKMLNFCSKKVKIYGCRGPTSANNHHASWINTVKDQ